MMPFTIEKCRRYFNQLLNTGQLTLKLILEETEIFDMGNIIRYSSDIRIINKIQYMTIIEYRQLSEILKS